MINIRCRLAIFLKKQRKADRLPSYVFACMIKRPTNKKLFRSLLIAGGILLLSGVAVYVYNATLTHPDTADLKAEYSFEAISFIKEFENDQQAANKKFAEKIIAINGVVTATETADTTINIKMEDSTSGSYIIFAFQDGHLDEAKTINPGDKVTIKGSCSDGIYSEILGSYFISFKRSTISDN